MGQLHCLTCQNKLYGRSDKKFCNSHCRNEFNNKRYTASNHYIRTVNRVLKRNRDIIRQLTTTNQKSQVTYNELSLHGFSFSHFTTSYTTKANKTYFFCYDYGYLKLDNGFFALVYNTTNTIEE